MSLPEDVDGLYALEPPKYFKACSAVASGDARGPNVSDPKNIALESHLNWGHAPAHSSKTVLVDAGGGTKRLPGCADEAGSQWEVCQAFGKAPHPPAAVTSAASAINERSEVDLAASDDNIVLRNMGMYSKYSILVRACSESPLEAWGAFAGSRSAALA